MTRPQAILARALDISDGKPLPAYVQGRASELEYYRRLLTPVIRSIGSAFLACQGIDAECTVEWENINLQDEISLAEARLKNAQAAQIEKTLADN